MPLLLAAMLMFSQTAASFAEVRHALNSGRLDQAQSMVVDLEGLGIRGPAFDRLRADLAFEQNKDAAALDLYLGLAAQPNPETLVLERAAIVALRLGRREEASALIEKAVARPDASWRAWNAKGAAADLAGNYPAADSAYARAQALAPDRAEIASNRGWSLLLRGQWAAAVSQLEIAVALDAKLVRARNNLELARAAVDLDLPLRRANEPEAAWAARLNDAGVAAAVKGDRSRAIAAFSQAIVASGSWNVRTAANLAQVEGSR